MTNDNDTNDEPYIVSLDAGTRGAPDGINLDVSGTVGPDHLGQQNVDVDGHWADKPGVRSRMPENDPSDPRIQRMDTGEDLPVLLSSDMSADPVEGVQGSYTMIEAGECPRCGYDRLEVTVATMPGEYHESCMACGANLRPRAEHGYTMPNTIKDDIEAEREAGEKLVDLQTREMFDLEDSTGFGPYVSLTGTTGVTRISKRDVETMFWALVDNDDIDVADGIKRNVDVLDRLAVAQSIIPKSANIGVPDEDEVTVEYIIDGEEKTASFDSEQEALVFMDGLTVSDDCSFESVNGLDMGEDDAE